MYVDRQLGQFVEALKKSGLYDTAVIAITSDHGNCWTEKCPGRIQAGRIKIVEDELVRVPTMIRAPGLTPRVDDGDFQLVDIFPSIMAAAGFPLDYVDSLDGRSGLVSTTPTRMRPFYQFPTSKPVDVGLPARAVDLSNAP